MARKKKDFFDEAQERICAEMAKYDVMSEEYKTLREELKNNIELRSSSRESKRKIAKSDRGALIGKALGLGAGILAIFGIAKFEKDGNTFTGEKRSLIDTIAKGVGRVFF